MQPALFDRELLKGFKFCTNCGQEAYGMEMTLMDDKLWTGRKCRKCGFEMRWRRSDKEVDIRERKGAPRPKLKQGDHCRKCGHGLLLRESNAKKRAKKSYYFTHYFWCNGCKTIYFDDIYKVINK